MRDITEAADVASRTFYLHFTSKADVALAQFYAWLGDLEAAMVARPEEETPDQMLRESLRALGELGYRSGQRLRDADGRPVPTITIGLLLTETSADIAGRVYQAIVAFQDSMTRELGRRMGRPAGSVEPRIVAAGLTAAWFVAVNGFGDLMSVEADPPPPDHLSTAAFDAYFHGTQALWQRPAEPG
jgi:AcrR family transcriptional regulator